jgi:hypothetical protein
MTDEESHRLPAEWPYLWLLAGWLVIVVIQMIAYLCLCAEGDAQVKAGLVLDALFLARLLLARLLHEKNRRWVLYAVVLATSLLWIPWIVDRHG